MRRFVQVAAALALVVPAGCQAPGLPFTWRSIGQYPGVDPTFYAYYFWMGKAYQVYQYNPPQVQTSAMQALADLGYGRISPKREGDAVTITAVTPDGRSAVLTIAPRNAMTQLTVRIGIHPCGDEPASKAIIDRIAQSFGTIERTLTPLEPTLQRRVNPWPTVPLPPMAQVPDALPVEMPVYLAGPSQAIGAAGAGPAGMSGAIPAWAIPNGAGAGGLAPPNVALPQGPVPYGPFLGEPATVIPPVAPSSTPSPPDF